MRKDPHSEAYERARDAFDDMKIEDRAVFLIEATVSTIARGIDQAGRAVADELDRLFRMRPESGKGAGTGCGSTEGGAAPPSEERRTEDDNHVET